MKIRSAGEDDAEKLAEAEWETAALQEGLLAAGPHEVSAESFRSKIRRVSGTGLYIVLEADGEIVGHLILEPMELKSTRHIVQLTIVVHPGHTGRGHGRALMNYAIGWAREAAGIEKIELRVRATNTRAIRLYEGLGFEREGILRRRIRTQSGYIDDICMALMVGAGDWVG